MVNQDRIENRRAFKTIEAILSAFSQVHGEPIDKKYFEAFAENSEQAEIMYNELLAEKRMQEAMR